MITVHYQVRRAVASDGYVGLDVVEAIHSNDSWIEVVDEFVVAVGSVGAFAVAGDVANVHD